MSPSRSDCSFKKAELPCVRGRASAQHEEGAPSAYQGVMESTLLLSPGHCCPSCLLVKTCFPCLQFSHPGRLDSKHLVQICLAVPVQMLLAFSLLLEGLRIFQPLL